MNALEQFDGEGSVGQKSKSVEKTGTATKKIRG